mmetsp:Transcript_48513/g.84539  ORF Transcript_48513/g.84539 Transcript_48513/m.84539 type:complete len:279 (-) Transcript_48513:140-976(-)
MSREGTAASRCSHMTREEVIEELEKMEFQLQETAEEKDTWKTKCEETENDFKVLKRQATEEIDNLRKHATEEIDTLKNQCEKAEGELEVIKRQITPVKLGMPQEDVETFLNAPEPGKAQRKVGRCLTNRKFIISMLYLNLACGAVYAYVVALHQVEEDEFIPRPTWLLVVDWVFCSIFFLAMILRLLVFRLSLRGFWNVFEFALLPLFIVEQAMSAASDESITDEKYIPRNTLQALRILFIFKLVPVLTRELKAARSKPEPPPEEAPVQEASPQLGEL